jgi:release factor glutamine methyltransferase
MSEPVSWRELWRQTEREVGAPQGRWLCEEASGMFGDEFLEVLDEAATVRMVAHLDAMLARARAGEPLQYVLGHWPFRQLDLMVDRRVLIPRPETEEVVGVALALLDRSRQLRCADLGCGSGAIGLSLAGELPRGRSEVWCTDVSTDALNVARANAAGLGLAASAVRFAEGSWWAALPSELAGTFDIVVSNPPYVAVGDPQLEHGVAAHEPALALFAGEDGLDAVRALLADAPRWLMPGGWLVVEIGASQGEAVRQLAAHVPGLTDVDVRPDAAGRDRVLLARRR